MGGSSFYYHEFSHSMFLSFLFGSYIRFDMERFGLPFISILTLRLEILVSPTRHNRLSGSVHF